MQYSNITDKWWTAADHLVTTASRHNSLICLLTFPVAEFLESVPGHGKPCKQAWCSRFRLMSSVPHRQILLCCTTTTCPATPQVTWPTIVSSSPTPVSDNSVLPTLKTLVVSRTRSSFGDRTFAAAGPQVWNSLPPNLRLWGLSHGEFRRLLKTFLFRQWGHRAVWTVFNCAEQK